MPRTIKTSVTDPIEIAQIHCPQNPSGIDGFTRARGVIGITLCPGKKGPSSFGGTWDRDLHTDVSAINQQLKPAVAVTLMTSSELHESHLLMRELDEAFTERRIQWIHLPTPELSSPDDSSAKLRAAIPYLLSLLMEGCNVLIHDRGGLGRSGSLAAVLLVELGMSNSDAITAVRNSRPGAIETTAQEQFVFNYIPYNLPHFFCHGCVELIIRIWGHLISPINNLLLKPEPLSRKLDQDIYRTFIQDFRHYMCGIGAQLDKITKSLGLSTKRFPVNFHRWEKIYRSPGSAGLYQPPDEPKLLVDWWRSISVPIIHSRFVDSSFGEQVQEDSVTIGWGETIEAEDGRIIITDGVKPFPIVRYVEAEECLYGKAPRRLITKMIQSEIPLFGGYIPDLPPDNWDLSKNQSIQLYESMYSIQKYFDDYYQRLNQMMMVHQVLLLYNNLPSQEISLWPRTNQYHREQGCTFPAFPSENRGNVR